MMVFVELPGPGIAPPHFQSYFDLPTLNSQPGRGFQQGCPYSPAQIIRIGGNIQDVQLIHHPPGHQITADKTIQLRHQRNPHMIFQQFTEKSFLTPGIFESRPLHGHNGRQVANLARSNPHLIHEEAGRLE
jgi:hypothetical protein